MYNCGPHEYKEVGMASEVLVELPLLTPKAEFRPVFLHRKAMCNVTATHFLWHCLTAAGTDTTL